MYHYNLFCRVYSTALFLTSTFLSKKKKKAKPHEKLTSLPQGHKYSSKSIISLTSSPLKSLWRLKAGFSHQLICNRMTNGWGMRRWCKYFQSPFKHRSHMVPSLRKVPAALWEETEAPPPWGIPRPKERIPCVDTTLQIKPDSGQRKHYVQTPNSFVKGNLCFSAEFTHPENDIQVLLGAVSKILNHDHTAVCKWHHHICKSWWPRRPVQTESLPNCLAPYWETAHRKNGKWEGTLHSESSAPGKAGDWVQSSMLEIMLIMAFQYNIHCQVTFTQHFGVYKMFS